MTTISKAEKGLFLKYLESTGGDYTISILLWCKEHSPARIPFCKKEAERLYAEWRLEINGNSEVFTPFYVFPDGYMLSNHTNPFMALPQDNDGLVRSMKTWFQLPEFWRAAMLEYRQMINFDESLAFARHFSGKTLREHFALNGIAYE